MNTQPTVLNEESDVIMERQEQKDGLFTCLPTHIHIIHLKHDWSVIIMWAHCLTLHTASFSHERTRHL